MKKYWIVLLALLMVCGSAAAEQPKGVPVEFCTVYANGSTESQIARWYDAGLERALHILDEMGITPRWPGFFPDGFDPEAEPSVTLEIRHKGINFSDFRTGKMVHREPAGDALQEYWELDPALFEQPTRIDISFHNKARDSHFVVIFYLGTVRNLTSPGRNIHSRHGEQLGNGMSCVNAQENKGVIGDGPVHWRQIYLYEDADIERAARGDRDSDDMMVAYEVRSTAMDIDLLMDVARGLKLWEAMP